MIRNFNKTIKNICIGTVLLSIVLISCKKNNKQADAPNGKLQKVTFVVNDFTQQHLGITANSVRTGSLTTNAGTDPIPTYPVLYYQVFDANSNFVHQIIQDNTTANFGTITDQLLPGKYTIIMVGGEDEVNDGSKLEVLSYVGIIKAAHDSMDYNYPIDVRSPDINPPLFFSETFYKKFSFTATSGTNSQNITLTHLVGQLVINIQDAIPSNVSLILFKITHLIHSADVYKGIPNPADTTTGYISISSGYTAGQTNYKLSNYIMNTIYPFSVSITAYARDAKGANKILVATKTINGVTCTANKQTVLTGNLFGGTGTSGVGSTTSFKADSSWNPIVLNYHF